MTAVELTEDECIEIRAILYEWVNEGFETPPYRDEVYSLLEKFGVSAEDWEEVTDTPLEYDIRRPRK